MKIFNAISSQVYRILLLVGILLLLGSIMDAQEQPVQYPFIKQDMNHLFYAKDSTAFLKFFKKLDKMREGKNNRINIVHIGGSHVQGGTWSNTFLADFQSEYKTAGGGYFTFPYKIAKTNSQPYATSFSNGKWKRCRAIGKEFCLPLGMSALSITTNDSTNYFGVALTQKAVCRYVNVVKLYHNFNSSFEFAAIAKDNPKAERKDFKDRGYTQFTFSMPVDSVNFELLRKDTLRKDFIIYGFSLENDMAPGFYLAGLGANGASSTSFLRCANLVSQLETLNADLVILSLGVNDTQSKGFEKDDYIEHYDSLITFIKKANPNVAIILTTTTDNYIKRKTANKRTITAHDAMFELMEKHHVAVWDLFTLMGGYKSMPKWVKAGLAAKDRVHFSGKGYVLLGNLMYEAVNKSYMNNQAKK
jgi:lysophospholipase L1-like esterase